MSIAEHTAVLAALEEIARREGTTRVALVREAVRALVRERAGRPDFFAALRRTVGAGRPELPVRPDSPARVDRFKKAQREYDALLLELGLATPAEIQEANSIAPSPEAVKILDFDRAHGTPPGESTPAGRPRPPAAV